MIRLGIIEDNDAIRQLLSDYFSEDEEISVIGASAHVDAYFAAYNQPPDIILLDLLLPFKNGKDCIRDIVNRYEGVSIIIHSVADDYESIFISLCNGAQSYLTKGESLEKVRSSIITTYNGGSQMSVEIARKVVNYFSKLNNTQGKRELLALNEKEMVIVQSIVNGRSYKMVAAELGISINTVRKYIKSIYRKLNINTNMELANIYLNNKTH
jgi:DNA-binding NarL/FixJ family response regulator